MNSATQPVNSSSPLPTKVAPGAKAPVTKAKTAVWTGLKVFKLWGTKVTTCDMLYHEWQLKNVVLIRPNNSIVQKGKLIELLSHKVMPDIIALRKKEFDALPNSARSYMRNV